MRELPVWYKHKYIYIPVYLKSLLKLTSLIDNVSRCSENLCVYVWAGVLLLNSSSARTQTMNGDPEAWNNAWARAATVPHLVRPFAKSSCTSWGTNVAPKCLTTFLRKQSKLSWGISWKKHWVVVWFVLGYSLAVLMWKETTHLSVTFKPLDRWRKLSNKEHATAQWSMMQLFLVQLFKTIQKM